MEAFAWTAICIAVVSVCFIDKHMGVKSSKIAKWVSIIMTLLAVIAGGIAHFSASA